MNTIAFIKMSLDGSKQWASQLLDDMKQTPLQQPTPQGGNHPMWILGHLAYSESFLFDECIHGKPNRFAIWQSLFAPRSTPVADAANYPGMDELFNKFDEIRADTLAHLEGLREEDLDRRSHAPEEFGPTFSTIGGCYYAMMAHVCFHSGQAADARRAAGKKPLMM